MMRKLRKKFTERYVCKGYTFGCDENLCAVWSCPWYIKPFLLLFSPSIYFCEITNSFSENFAKGFMEGYTKGIELKNTTEEDGE